MKFERYDNIRRPYKGGGNKMVATLSGNAKAPTLTLGAYLRDLGFDHTKRYSFLWNAKTLTLGLEPNESGFKVIENANGSLTSRAFSMQARGFCEYFEIKERLEAVSAKPDNGVWILKMRKVQTNGNR